MPRPTAPRPSNRRARLELERLEDRVVPASYPLTALPTLHSNAAATAKLYLDFDGNYEPHWGGFGERTGAAASLLGFGLAGPLGALAGGFLAGETLPAPVTPPFNLAGDDPNTFSDQELAIIREVWARVAEDYAPFNLDVTTQNPGDFSNGRGLRVAIGGSSDDWYIQDAGGTAIIGSFSNVWENTVFVFSDDDNGNAANIANAAAHEAGHAFGLDHQGGRDANGQWQEYYDNLGSPSKAPIMGWRDNAFRGVWWSGRTSEGGGLSQSDMSVIAGPDNGFGYRADDHAGALNASATSVTFTRGVWSRTGIVERTFDRDAFRFEAEGPILVQVTVADVGPNLDAWVGLYDATGRLVASADPNNGTSDRTDLDALLRADVARGTYYVVVGSHGIYGDVGQYTVRVEDLRATAAFLGNNGFQRDVLERPTDEDWYVVTSSGSIHTMRVDLAANVDARLELRNAQGNVVASAGPRSTGIEMRRTLAAGRYYLVVAGAGGADDSGAYTVTFEDTRQRSGALVMNYSFPGATDFPGDEDWYRFDVYGVPGSYTLRSQAAFTLADAQGNTVAQRFLFDATGSLTRTLAAGRYYVIVHSGVNPYTIAVEENRLRVVQHEPSPDRVRLTFNKSVDPATFTTGNTAMPISQGSPSFGTANSVTPVAGTDNRVWDVVFSARTGYRLTVGPDIRDRYGNRMDQDGDWVLGEGTEDRFVTEDYTPPRALGVVVSEPTSAPGVPVVGRSLLLTFSEAMDPASLTWANIVVTGPNGVRLTGFTAGLVSGSGGVWTYSLGLPTGAGNYTVTLTDGVRDRYGNRLDVRERTTTTVNVPLAVRSPNPITQRELDQIDRFERGGRTVVLEPIDPRATRPVDRIFF